MSYFYTRKQIEDAKKLGEPVRKMLGSSFMIEAELTDLQRESKQPIGNKGYYRMYRWECRLCGIHGVKMPLSEAMQSGTSHAMSKHDPDILNPPVHIIGGVFPKGDLYKE